MNPWWILLVVVLLAGAGWYYLGRFVGRWLLPVRVCLPGATAGPAGHDAVTCVASQAVLLLGGGLFIGIPLTSLWGWGPALLWLLVGGIGICGFIAAGLHFLDSRYPMDGFSAVSRDLLGPQGSWSLALLLQIAASLIHILLLLVASQLMALFPVAASLILVHVVPLWIVKRTKIFRAGVYGVLLLTGLWLLALVVASVVPLRLAGEIQLLTFADSQWILPSSSFWLLAIVGLVAYLLSQGQATLTLYRLTAGMICALLLLTGLLGLLTLPAVMVVPRVAEVVSESVLPGLLIALPAITFGAWYLLTIAGSGRSQQRMSPLQGYAGIILVVVAGSVLLVMIGAGEGQAGSLTGSSQQSLQYVLSAALVRVAELVSQLGIPTASSLGLVGFTAIVLFAAALQAGIRGQKIVLNDALRDFGIRRTRVSSLWLMAFSAALALFILPGQDLTALWVAWGIASALVSAGILAMTGLALLRQQRAGNLALCLGFLVWGVGQWAGIQHVFQHTGDWKLSEILYIVLLLIGCWLLLACVPCWWKLRLAAARAPNKINLQLR